MVIKVTEDDIKQGVKGACFKCPVAIAMRRQGLKLAGAGFAYLVWQPKLYGNMKYDSRGYINMRLDTPLEVRRFISSFDKEEIVSPFEFEIPDELLKSDAIPKS